MTSTSSTRSTTIHRSSRSGFAVITAIVVMALVAAVSVAMASYANMQIRRSSAAWDEAQLRQLLLAGEVAARQLLASPAMDRCELPMPQPLAAGGASVVCTRDPARPGIVTVQATLRGHVRQQRLIYQQEGGAWRLTSALLDPP